MLTFYKINSIWKASIQLLDCTNSTAEPSMERVNCLQLKWPQTVASVLWRQITCCTSLCKTCMVLTEMPFFLSALGFPLSLGAVTVPSRGILLSITHAMALVLTSLAHSSRSPCLSALVTLVWNGWCSLKSKWNDQNSILASFLTLLSGPCCSLW